MADAEAVKENLGNENESLILEEQLRNWLKSTLKDNLRINDSICNEFVNFSTNSFRVSVENGDAMLLIVLEKVFPEIKEGEFFDGDMGIRNNFRSEAVDDAKIKSAVKFQPKKHTKKQIKKLKKPKSKSPSRRPISKVRSSSKESKRRSSSRENKKKKLSISKSASSSKKRSEPPSRARSRTVSPLKPKSAAEQTADGRESAHSKESDSIRFFLEDEIEEPIPTKEEEMIHHKTYDTEDHGEWELKLFNEEIIPSTNRHSTVVKNVFYLLKKSFDDSSKIKWSDDINAESITRILLKHYFIGFVHNYAALNCTAESILEILGSQLSDPKPNHAFNLAFLAFHITCQPPEIESDIIEIDSLTELAILFCKNSMQIVEDFQFIFGLSNNIKSLIGQNDDDRFNEIINKVNSWIDLCQKMIGRDNFTKKKDPKNVKTLLDSYCRSYLVAKCLKLDFDSICNFEANSVRFNKLTKNLPGLDSYSNLLNRYLDHRKSVVQYLLPFFSLTIVDGEQSIDIDYDLIEITLQATLDFCSEFQNVESLKNLIESLCVDLVNLIGYKMQPSILFGEGSLMKNFYETRSFVMKTSESFLNWRNTLDRMLKSFKIVEKFDDNYEIWMKILNQALQTSQYLVEFVQMLSTYFDWLYNKNENEIVIEEKDKCWDIIEEIEKDLQQVTDKIIIVIKMRVNQ